MRGFLLRRLFTVIPVVLLVSILTFSLLLLLPGDPVYAILGTDRGVDRATYDALRHELGFDRPIPIQYLDWLGNAVRGDLGQSLRTHERVAAVIATRLPVTLELGALAMLLAVLLGITTGIIAAVRPNSFLDLVSTTIALSGIAFPSFWLGILLIFLFSLRLHWLPPTGYVAPAQGLGMHLRLLVMPALTVAVGPAAVLTRQMRSALLDVLSNDYVTTARAKGLRERTVITGHTLKNALIPVITILGTQIGHLVGGAVIAETIFSIPGMGLLLVNSLSFRDFPMVQGVVLVLALAVLASNLLADLLYAYLDPRIRYA